MPASHSFSLLSDIPLFGWTVGVSHALAITNAAAWHALDTFVGERLLLFLLGAYVGVELLGHVVSRGMAMLHHF